MAGMHVLNIPVAPERLHLWRSWLAPERQPFFLTVAEAGGLNLSAGPRSELVLTDVERDTFRVWRIPRDIDQVVWFSRAEWAEVSPGVRRELLRLQVRHGRGNVPLGSHYVDLLPDLRPGRFLWRPEHLLPEVLARVVEGEQQTSQHEQVSEGVWQGAQGALPGVRELAGTFSNGVGNCFGTVMAAAVECPPKIGRI